MALVALTVTLLAAATPVWVLGGGVRPVSAQSVGQLATVPPPVVPGAGAAYLGAFVDPAGTALSTADPTGGTASLPDELAALPAFDEQGGEPPSILSTYQDWGEPADVAGLESVAATGAVPMVTWNCGDTDANVAAGVDDATVGAEARALAASNVPVLFRWFPDPNMPGSPAVAACLGTGGASGYVAAFRHVHNVFEAMGATNVAFVWSVDTSAGAGPLLTDYYPGAGFVDWLGADDRAPWGGTGQRPAFSTAFDSWYSDFSSAGKPMMVSSAGADGGSQAAYLGQVLSELPNRFPGIKAFVYFDAPDVVSTDQYELSAAGAAAYQGVAGSPYFDPSRARTVTTASSSQPSVGVGTMVTLDASVDVDDNSGSVSFVDNGTALAGCVFIPIRTPPSCQTSQLSTGTQSIVAFYTGDSSFAPSASAPVIVTVGAPGVPKPVPGVSPRADVGGPATTTTMVGSGHPPLGATGMQAPAAGSAYVGAFVDPSGSELRVSDPTGGVASLPAELTALPTVEQTLARPLSIVSLYLNWNDSITVTELDQVMATGGVPMITWNCGGPDASVANGSDDNQINLLATKLAQFKLPVFLRWFPDPNLQNAANRACLGGGGAGGYVAAYRYIHRALAAAGASNVSFVWSVDTTSPRDDPSWSSYYPGATYVDWIGADGYASSTTTSTVSADFGAWYAHFAGDKPLMISQTAAVPSLQAQYIDQLSNVPTQYPQIKAVIYFDAPDVTIGRSYELQPQSPGEQRLAALSDEPSFQGARNATTAMVTASANPVSQGQPVQLSAEVTRADAGGHLAFSDNGSPIPGCGAVALDLAASCATSTLPLGPNEIVAAYSGDAVSGSSVSAPLDLVVTSTPAPIGPPPIPGPSQAYLGAWVRPDVTHSALPLPAAILEELTSLPAFDAGLARPLSIVHLYQTWKYPASSRQVQQVLADGSIPMIDWSCGDTDANIIAGKDDALITAEAQMLASLKSPVFLRWYYEPNFPNSADYAACIGSLGPAGYAAAFRHIHDLFVAAGASNVAFVFAISTAGADQDLYQYYPGSSSVDWIAADGYVRTTNPIPTAFVEQFGSWYSDFASFGKPMMVSETAAFAGGQANYLQQIEDQLSPTGAYPLIKAVMYFDAPGKNGHNTYPMNPSGWEKFQTLSADPLFQPARVASTVAARAAPASSMAGDRVQLEAHVSNSDFGGAVSFQVNGAPLPGCQSIPVAAMSRCSTTLLPVGNDQISATYSGDAEVAGSRANIVSKVVSGSSQATPSGSAPASAVPNSPFGFPPFSGQPDIGGVASLGWPGYGGKLFEFPTVLGLPGLGAPPGAAGTSNLDPIGWADRVGLGGGVASVLVPVGTAIIVVLLSYMLSTWMQDRRRRRSTNARVGSDGSEQTLGPSNSEEPALS